MFDLKIKGSKCG